MDCEKSVLRPWLRDRHKAESVNPSNNLVVFQLYEGFPMCPKPVFRSPGRGLLTIGGHE